MSLAVWGPIAAQAGGFLLSAIVRYVDGENSPEILRVVDVLPAELRADVEHARQRALLDSELRSDLGLNLEARALDLESKLEKAGMPNAGVWARAVHGLQLPPLVGEHPDDNPDDEVE